MDTTTKPNAVAVAIPSDYILAVDEIEPGKLSPKYEKVMNQAVAGGSFACEIKDGFFVFLFDDPYRAIEYFNWARKSYRRTRIENKNANNVNNIKGHEA